MSCEPKKPKLTVLTSDQIQNRISDNKRKAETELKEKESRIKALESEVIKLREKLARRDNKIEVLETENAELRESVGQLEKKLGIVS